MMNFSLDDVKQHVECAACLVMAVRDAMENGPNTPGGYTDALFAIERFLYYTAETANQCIDEQIAERKERKGGAA